MLKMWTHREGSYFESAIYEQNIMLTMDNYVHDRLLVDPAYRMWRFNHGEEKVNNYKKQDSMQTLYRNQKYRIPMQKTTYTAVLEAEKIMGIQQRLKREVNGFHVREYLDVANHAKRERRMRLKQKERWENNYAYFYDAHTEAEQLYDYIMIITKQFKNYTKMMNNQNKELMKLLHKLIQDIFQKDLISKNHILIIRRRLNFTLRKEIICF